MIVDQEFMMHIPSTEPERKLTYAVHVQKSPPISKGRRSYKDLVLPPLSRSSWVLIPPIITANKVACVAKEKLGPLLFKFPAISRYQHMLYDCGGVDLLGRIHDI
ncbi:hypothetical protein TWF173_009216 [Orbilia oligospora]|nr:hypothetical protein TWF173_009216 [Orbilia oligospora]